MDSRQVDCGEDQYSVPRAGWVRNVEMNMQMEERKVEDVNKSSCGASPLPHPTHSNSYSCSELQTSQECSLPTAQPHPRVPSGIPRSWLGGKLGRVGLFSVSSGLSSFFIPSHLSSGMRLLKTLINNTFMFNLWLDL